MSENKKKPFLVWGKQSYELEIGKNTIGNAPKSDHYVSIDIDSAAYATINISLMPGNEYMAAISASDENSRITVDGEKLDYGSEKILDDGSVVYLGKVKVVYVEMVPTPKVEPKPVNDSNTNSKTENLNNNHKEQKAEASEVLNIVKSIEEQKASQSQKPTQAQIPPVPPKDTVEEQNSTEDDEDEEDLSTKSSGKTKSLASTIVAILVLGVLVVCFFYFKHPKNSYNNSSDPIDLNAEETDTAEVYDDTDSLETDTIKDSISSEPMSYVDDNIKEEQPAETKSESSSMSGVGNGTYSMKGTLGGKGFHMTMTVDGNDLSCTWYYTAYGPKNSATAYGEISGDDYIMGIPNRDASVGRFVGTFNGSNFSGYFHQNSNGKDYDLNMSVI